MQRSTNSTGEHQMPPAPLATTGNSGYAIPGMQMAPGQTMAPPATARGWPTLPELFNALKRRLVLATFLGILVGMAAAAAVWLALPNGKHKVRAMLQLKPRVQIGTNASPVGEFEFEMFKKTQHRLITGRILLDRVVGTASVARLPDIKNSDDAVRYLEESIGVTWDSPELMVVSMNGDDPKQLKEILQVLVNEYQKDSSSDEIKARAKLRAVIEGNLSRIEKEMKTLIDRMEKNAMLGNGVNEKMMELNAKSLQEEISRLSGQMFSHKSDLDALKIKMIQAVGKQAVVDKQEISQDDLEKALMQDEEVGEKVRLRDAQKLLVERAIATGVAGNITITNAEAALTQLEKGVRDATQKKQSTVEQAIRKRMTSVVVEDIALLKNQIDFHTKSLANLTADYNANKTRYSQLNQNGAKVLDDAESLKPWREDKATQTRQLLELNNLDQVEARVQIRENPIIILNQNLKQKLLLSLAALIAGLTMIMLSVAFLEWRSRRVDSVDQVVNELGIRVIGTIPAFPSKQSLKSGDAAQSQNWRFVLNESVNSARTMLLHTAKTQNMQVLMVTSAMQGEGKTSLASQLATSMATAGLRTLILDCDLRNPSMHKLFDAPLTPGCSEILCQEIDVSDAVQPTSVPNLWLIPAGQCSNRVISALAQGHPLETLFNRLRGQFDFVVVDSCPVLPVADSLLVGQHVDGVVISILQDISQLPKVMTVAEKLNQLNIPLLGAVVNGIKADIHAYGYNYVKQLPA